MQEMRYFIDAHDRRNGTFPFQISKDDFASFFRKYEAACREEGVVLLRVHVGLEQGRAYCFTASPSVEAIQRAHDRMGLPFDVLTEVATATPGDLFFAPMIPHILEGSER